MICEFSHNPFPLIIAFFILYTTRKFCDYLTFFCGIKVIIHVSSMACNFDVHIKILHNTTIKTETIKNMHTLL